MRNAAFVLGAVAVGVATWTLGAGAAPSPAASRVERGRYLVTIAACHDCHTPKIDAQMTLSISRRGPVRGATATPRT